MRRLGYEKELIGVLEGLVRDMDRKIERQKERAEKESAPKPLTDANRAQLDEMLARQKGVLPPADTVWIWLWTSGSQTVSSTLHDLCIATYSPLHGRSSSSPAQG